MKIIGQKIIRAAGAKIFRFCRKNWPENLKIDQKLLNITTSKGMRAAGVKFLGFTLLKSP